MRIFGHNFPVTRERSTDTLLHDKDFWRSQRQDLPKRRVEKDTEQALRERN